MDDWLLILRDHEERWDRFTQPEYERVLAMFDAWNKQLASQGRFVTAGKLTSDRGATLRERDGEVVVDGPYAEAREAIGGFYRVQATSLEDALAIARGCPILTYGGSVEVRPMFGPSSPRAERSPG